MSSFSDILCDLTDAQLEAVTHRLGPMLVVAGAGSGKTRVVTRRIAQLIAEGCRPDQILAMTFTNKAANEMKERIATLVGVAPRHVGTFHSCCARFLRQDIERLKDGRNSNYTIYDSNDQNSLLKQCIKELKIDKSECKPGEVAQLISKAKTRRMDIADYIQQQCSYDAEVYTKCAAEYERRLRKQNAVDFDDLLLLCARILSEFPIVREMYQSRFKYLLIDEYQDTNQLQYDLMKLLCGEEQNVHATGDPDQSIYSWRGANYENIMGFTRDFPDAKIVQLEQNYRSTQRIIHAANELIQQNDFRLEKKLFTENELGSPLRIICVADETSEAQWLCRRISKLCSEGHSLRDMAVFYRTNGQSRSIEDGFMRSGIPYQVVGSLRFYERQEIKDLLAFLRIKCNPADEVSLQRVLACQNFGVGPKKFAAIAAAAARCGLPVFDFLCGEDFPQQFGATAAWVQRFGQWCRALRALPDRPVDECIAAILEHSGLIARIAGKDDRAAERIENIQELLAQAKSFVAKHGDCSLLDYLQEVSLVSDLDNFDSDADRVSLMTLHCAKGLEFPYVFIAGAEEGYLPHQHSSHSSDEIEEERRLLYVGLTRAQAEVTVLFAQGRFSWSGAEAREPSRFLAELPAEVVQRLVYRQNRTPSGRRRNYRIDFPS
jgi:DNA helicase-2/ATP-dependent DNA helicase PcrA